MKFVKAVWKLLVGIKDALVLLFMLLFFGALYFALSARPEPVGEGILALKLDGPVVEQPSRPGFSDLATGSGRPKEYRLADLVEALDEAREDDRVKGIALDLDEFGGGGQTALADLAGAIREFRKSGKPVIAYATAYDDDRYLLASAASEIWLNPLGGVVAAGPGGNSLYFRGLLEKLGVTPHVYRVGTYKAAVEPFTRDDMSAEARENAQALAGALLETWRQSVLSARPKAKLDAYMRDTAGAVRAAGGDLARAALAAGLVDRLAERRLFQAKLAELGGKNERDPAGFKAIAIKPYVEEKVRERQDGAIGVVTVAGMIVDGKAAPGTAGGESIAHAIERGLASGRVKALVVRIDSPGGSVTASERIRQALLAAKEKKIPVVASMGNVAASGGYWVATAADHIYAEPSTITGSIGVFGILPSFEGTRQKLGLGADGVKTTPLSGEPDLLNGPSPEANQLLQTGVESVYRRFLAIVAQSRRKPPAEIDRIAQGRVWDGGTARQLGLVDSFGSMNAAITKAAELARLGEDERTIRYLERPPSFEDAILEMLSSDRDDGQGPTDVFAAVAGNPQRHLADALGFVERILSGPRLQALCLDCPVPSAGSTPVKASDGGFLSLLARLFG